MTLIYTMHCSSFDHGFRIKHFLPENKHSGTVISDEFNIVLQHVCIVYEAHFALYKNITIF